MSSAHPPPPTPQAQGSPFLLIYKSKRVIIARPASYEACYASVIQNFPEIPSNHKITFHTKDLNVCEGHLAQISRGSWDTVFPLLNSITIQAEDPVAAQQSDHTASFLPLTTSQPPDIIQLSFHHYQGSVVNVRVKRTTEIAKMFALVAERFNEDEPKFVHNGNAVSRKGTVATAGLEDGDVIDVYRTQRGGKPVIYLYAPSELMVSVKLSLVPQWSFSAIYPVVPIKHVKNEQLEWKVRVKPNGELTELNTGLDVAYLFWEAHTGPPVPVSPPHSPIVSSLPLDVEVFNPSDAHLSDNDSVVISVDTITPYLDAALKALGLHTEARTSFITYWLPAILKHDLVALRFLSQSAYEQAAPLKISPVPDVITRIFMLFIGVDKELLPQWPQAQERASHSVDLWKDVVGVDCTRSLDQSLFRVLEWGGMEVLQ